MRAAQWWRGGLVMLAAFSLFAARLRAETPFVVDEWKFGRRDTGSSLAYCVDKRDPDWRVAGKVASAIAGALLIEPHEHLIDEDRIVDGIDDLYRMFRATCDIFMGFKLIPDTYPEWMTLTRAYYRGAYVIGAADTQGKALADMPLTTPIAATLGSLADIRLTQYLASLPEQRRWARFPMASDEAALRAVLDGTAGAALVWEPALWALRERDAAFAKLRPLSSAPLPTMTADVSAALLADDAFLRANLDRAIASLIADGTLQRLYDAERFPGRAAP